MSADIKVRGLRDVEQMMLDLRGPEMTRALRLAMLKAAQPIETAAKERAPVGSGALRESIGRWFQAEKKEVFGISLPNMGGRFKVKVGAKIGDRAANALHNLAYKRKRRGIFYAHFLEFGTKRMSRRAFLTPALQSTSAEAIETFDRDIRARIKRLAKRKK